MKSRQCGRIAAALVVVLVAAGSAVAQEPTQEERIAALKESLATMEALKGYEWTETTLVSHDGDEVSHTQAKCRYGSDGKVAKEPMGTPPEKKEKKGLRGRRAKKKKAEIEEYMKQVDALVHSYVPPNAEQIQKSKEAGKFTIEVTDPGKKAVLRFGDYNLPGDSVGIEVDLTTNTVLGYDVASYLESPDDAVTLNVDFRTLGDGTLYPAHIVLDAAGKDMRVDVSNTDYVSDGG